MKSSLWQYTQTSETLSRTRRPRYKRRLWSYRPAVERLEERTTPAITLQPWTTVAPMPTTRGQAAAAADPNSGLIYVAGGYQNGNAFRTFEIYNTATNSWTTGPNLPTAVRGATASYAAGSIYVFGGFDNAVSGGILHIVQRYNISTNSWSTISYPPGLWESGSATAINGKIYVMGGEANGTQNVEFDPATSSFVSKASRPTSSEGLEAGTIGGFVYTVGGTGSSRVDRYDPVANSWSTAPADLPIPITRFAAGVGDGNFIVAGGSSNYFNTGTPFFNSVYTYDPVVDTWISQPSLPTGVRESVGAAVNGKMYVIGGYNGSFTNTVYASQFSAPNVAPALSNLSVSTPINENAFATLTGTITDPNVGDSHSVEVDWDDPSAAAPSTFSLPATSSLSAGQNFASSTDTATLSIVSVNSSTGVINFSVQHRYKDDGPAPGNGTTADVSTIKVSVTDSGTSGGGSGKIALEAAGDNLSDTIPFVKTLLQANGYTVDIVSGSQIDTAAELSQYAAVLIGDSGHGDNDWDSFGLALETYVNAGGGFLSSGWVPYFLQGSSGSGYDALERLLPVNSIAAYDYQATITPTVAHPINAGVSPWVADAWSNYGGAVKPGATVIAANQFGHAEALVWNVGLGRVEHLSPNYLVSFHHYAQQSQLDGSDPSALAMFLNSVAWVSGGSSGGGGSDTESISITVNNVAPTLSGLSATAINENGVTTLTGTLSDPGTLDTFTLTVNWGDPTSPNNLQTFTLGASATGSQTFTLTHQYLDDKPSGTPADVKTIFLFAADDDSGANPGVTTVTVTNVAPTVGGLSATAIFENGITTLTGTLSDPGTLDTFSLTVNWGDPTSPNNLQTFTFGASASGSQTFTLTHQYLDDNPTGTPADSRTIFLFVADDDGGASPGVTTVSVTNVAPTLSGLSATAIFENGVTTLTGTLSDPGTLDTFSLTVNWGDPTSPNNLETYTFGPSATGSQTFSLTHQYLDDKPSGTPADVKTIFLFAADDDSGASPGVTTVTVTNVAPTLSGLSATAVSENGVTTLTGTLSDPGTLDTFSLTVNWGDPLSPNNVETYSFAASPTGTQTFTLTHQYLDDNPTATASDSYTIALAVVDDDTGSGAGGTTVTVNNVAPVLDPLTGPFAGVQGQWFSFTGVQGQPLSFAGSFSDVGTLDTHKVAWDFGDGVLIPLHPSTDAGALTPGHTYTSTGTFTIQLIVEDDDGGTATLSRTITISDVELQADPCDTGATALVVGGTTGDDKIHFIPQGNAGAIKVTVNNVVLGTFTPTGSIIAYGQAGDDDIQVAGSITLATLLYGDDGDDRLNGGNGHNTILGGAGDDTLIGGSDCDLLIGGTGADRLVGNAGDDILIGGVTVHDDDHDALCAIMDEWCRTDRTYAQRIDALMSGGGLNGTYKLNKDTVLNDFDEDVLTGSAGLDWFFFDPTRDRATDLKNEASVTDSGFISP